MHFLIFLGDYMKIAHFFQLAICFCALHPSSYLEAVQTRSKKLYGYYEPPIHFVASHGEVKPAKHMKRKKATLKIQNKHITCPHKGCQFLSQSQAHLIRHYERHYPFHYMRNGEFKSKSSLVQSLSRKKNKDGEIIYEDATRKQHVMNIINKHMKALAKIGINKLNLESIDKPDRENIILSPEPIPSPSSFQSQARISSSFDFLHTMEETGDTNLADQSSLENSLNAPHYEEHHGENERFYAHHEYSLVELIVQKQQNLFDEL
jgi:hypothetical protein